MSSAKILLAEDDLFLRELYVETLQSEGFTVESAIDGEEAYAKIKSNEWDLVLLDILMPKMTGLEVMHKLKNESGDIFAKKVVFLTNVENDKEMQEALSLGDDYVIKSKIVPNELVDRVKVHLAKKELPLS